MQASLAGNREPQLNDEADRRVNRQVLRPRARLIHALGQELISSETVALIELVKNAYDADAHRVFVVIEPEFVGNPSQSYAGHDLAGLIAVIDDGHGMDVGTVHNSFLEPATRSKRTRTHSESGRRRLLGAKGIGRFAAAKLADHLDLFSRRANAPHEVVAAFNWTDFESEERYLDQVSVTVEERSPETMTDGGWLQRSFGVETTGYGTALIMRGLRSPWTEKSIQDVRIGLSRLLSPFSGDDDFSISLRVGGGFEHLSEEIGPPDILDHFRYHLSGEIDADGLYRISVEVPGDKQIYEGKWLIDERNSPPEASEGDGRPPTCGPLVLEYRIWDRDPQSMKVLAEATNQGVRTIRNDLDERAGVNVYRDGFRVLPYGDVGDDWLRLDYRRIQNPTMRISNNQVLGYVLISAESNPNLRDQTNREGLVSGVALDDMRALLGAALSLVERRRYKYRRSLQQPPAEPTPGRGLLDALRLEELSSFVETKRADDDELRKVLAATHEDLDRSARAIDESLTRYRRLAMLGQVVDFVLHEGNRHLGLMRTAAQRGIRVLVREGAEMDGELLSKLRGLFDVVEEHGGHLSGFLKKIEPFSGRKRGRPSKQSLESIVRRAVSLWIAKAEELSVEIIPPPGNDVTVSVDASEIMQVINNLLENSLYWLAHVPPDKRKIEVKVERGADGAATILVEDSGPGVATDAVDHIFDAYYSTKPDGTGLGLSIVGEIVTDYYGGRVDLVAPAELGGACFRVQLQRRV